MGARPSSAADAPASRRMSAGVAPVVTAMPAIPARTQAIMSQRESPTYQHLSGATPSSRAASSSRSGSGLACSTWLASVIRGAAGSRSAETDAAIWPG